MFAPAWTYEHFPPTIAGLVDRAVWEGTCLPTHLNCGCNEGKPHHREGYRQNPLISAAQHYPAASELYFETDFRCAFEQDDHGYRSRIGDVTPQPLCGEASAPSSWVYITDVVQQMKLSGHFVADPIDDRLHSLEQRLSHFQIDLERSSHGQGCLNHHQRQTLRLPLYNLNMTGAGLVARLTYNTPGPSEANTSIYFKFASSSGEIRYHDVSLERTEIAKERDAPLCPSNASIGFELEEVGIYCHEPRIADKVFSQAVLNLFHLTISTSLPLLDLGSIDNIRCVRRNSGSFSEDRWAWDWSFPEELWPTERPWGRISGPFERFDVYVDGEFLGSSRCTEIALRGERMKNTTTSKQAKVRIQARYFAGGCLIRERVVRLSE